MASVSTGGNTYGVTSATLYGSWSGFNNIAYLPTDIWFDYGPGALIYNTDFVQTSDPSGSWNQGISTTADTTYLYKARTTYPGAGQGSTESFKTDANSASISGPTSSGVTQTTATCSITFNPNVVESSYSLYLNYKKNTDPSYTQIDTSGATSRQLTGLTPGTLYDFYWSYTRTTNNGTSGSSAGAQFTTRAAQTVVTNAATGVTAAGAQLNGTVNAVSASNSVSYYFQWGLTTSYGTTTATQGPTSTTSDLPFSAAISGLVPNTTYHFRAVGVTSEYTVNGSDQQFTTSVGDTSVLRL